MKLSPWIVGLLLAVVASVVGASDGSGAVPVLKAASFDNFLKENPVSLVKFMAPWCGHCQQLAPEYEAAAVELQKREVKVALAEVDATEEKDLAEKYEIQGFPTIFLFRDGRPEPYSGGRTRQSIIDWVSTMTGPALEWLEDRTAFTKVQQDIKLAAEDGAHPAVGFFITVPSKDHDAFQQFESVAHVSRTRGKFFAMVDPAAKNPEVVAQRRGEDPAISSTVFHSKDRFTAWVHTESFHLFGEVTPENYAALVARSPNWLWFAGHREDFEKYAPIIRRVSRNYRSDFNFVWLNIETHKAHAESGLGLTSFPGIVVAWDGANYHYATDITERGLTKFVEAVKGGKVAKFVKSEPVPETNDELVKVVVGKTFSEMVLQKDKDVFLKIYAPWCGHCQKLAPVWERLAEVTKGSQNLVVAKFDGTANEPDVDGFKYDGFPMLFFVPAGAKQPIKYDGNRDLLSLVDFVKSHAKYPVAISDDLSKDEL